MASETRRRSDAPPVFGRRHGFVESTERAADIWPTLLRLWGYLRRRRNALILTSIFVALASIFGLLGPYLLTRAIDGYILRHNLPGLERLAGLMLAVYAAHSLCVWLPAYIMAGAAQETVRDIRTDLFGRLQKLPLRFFDQSGQGDLMSRLTNDVENINLVLSDCVTQLVSGVLSMVGVATAMFLLNARMAAVSITVTACSTLLINRWIAKTTREGFRGQQATLGELNSFIEETISGQRVVQAYGREAAAMERLDLANAKLRKEATRAQTYAGAIGPFMNCTNNAGMAIVAGFGGVLVVNGLATVGILAGFINYTRQFGRPLNEIANLYNTIQAAIAGAERVFEVIDEEPEVDVSDAAPLPAASGDIRFEHVNFSYDGTTPVLRDVSLHARPGQTVALIGATGAGKTTIINVLTRFYEIDSGTITIDGADIKAIRKDDLRRLLGIVLQDTFLFSGTVRDNIRYGRLDATDNEIVAAARLANADPFIRRLPHGYDTVLSERAGNVSQGQRQLLAIARAILANHTVLILDEATSNVDTRTEKHLQEAMKRLMTGRTSLVIAHRLSTIRDADEILVMHHGRVIEHGNHASLLAQKGFYYNLYSRQFRGAATWDPDSEAANHLTEEGGHPAPGPAALTKPDG